MDAKKLLDTLGDAGLTVEADGQSLKISPAVRFTAELRDLVKANKAALLAALATPATDPNEDSYRSAYRALVRLWEAKDFEAVRKAETFLVGIAPDPASVPPIPF